MIVISLLILVTNLFLWTAFQVDKFRIRAARLNNALLVSEAWRRNLAVDLCEACDQLEDVTDGTADDRIADWREDAVLSESCLQVSVLACDR